MLFNTSRYIYKIHYTTVSKFKPKLIERTFVSSFSIRYTRTLDSIFSCVFASKHLCILCYTLDIDESLIDGRFSFTSLKKSAWPGIIFSHTDTHTGSLMGRNEEYEQFLCVHVNYKYSYEF